MNHNENPIKDWMWAENFLFIQIEQICFADDQAPPG